MITYPKLLEDHDEAELRELVDLVQAHLETLTPVGTETICIVFDQKSGAMCVQAPDKMTRAERCSLLMATLAGELEIDNAELAHLIGEQFAGKRRRKR